MADTKTPLKPDGFYHIFNHATGDELLFRTDNNYLFFLKKYYEYISPIAETFCYCLMPNHFHFLIKIKEENEIENFFKLKAKTKNLRKKTENLRGFQNLVGLEISKQFGHFFNSYAKAYNKEHLRIGSLFANRFKRKSITDQKYLLKLVHYIHYNPVNDGYCENIEKWEYSSYNALISKKPTKLKREEVISWFEDRENFIFYHNREPDIDDI